MELNSTSPIHLLDMGIATCYGLDNLGFEFRLGTLFSAPVETDSGAPLNCLYNGYRVYFHGVKLPGPDPHGLL